MTKPSASLTKKICSENCGVTLVELLIVLVIVLILVAMGGVILSPSITKRRVLSCASNVMTDIQLIRSRAQSEGRRTVFQLTSTSGPEDIDGDGFDEFYIGYIDQNGNSAFDAGTDSIIMRGKEGNPLCNQKIDVDSGTSLNSIVFGALGFLISGAANRNIYFTTPATDVVSRVELVSITGMLRSYMNDDNCGGDGCSTSDTWEELK